MTTVNYFIPSINCGGCKARIENWLVDVEGIQSVQVNVPTKQAVVTFDAPTTDTSMRQLLPRLSLPVFLIYGAKDLLAPVEVGQSIYQGISTPESQKTLLILPNSRHSVEGDDVPLMQTAIKDFIDQTLMLEK